MSGRDAKPNQYQHNDIHMSRLLFTCVLKLASNKPAEQKEMDRNKTVLASIKANSNWPSGASKLIKILQMVATKVSWNDRFDVPLNSSCCSK